MNQWEYKRIDLEQLNKAQQTDLVQQQTDLMQVLTDTVLRCPKCELGLVLPAPRGGIQQHTNTQDRFRKLLAKLEATMRWHDMRHFAVSLRIEQCFSIKEIVTFAGHYSIQMTMER